MRLVKVLITASLVVAMMTVAAPSEADAFFRVGGDVRWVPLAQEQMEEDGEEFEPQRQLESLGVAGRVLIGFEHFSVGGRLGLTHHVFSDHDLNFTQLDLNAHVRSGLPLTRVNFYAEVGPTLALNLSEVGYNGGVGVEVDVLGWPLVDLNLGLGLQYAHVFIGTGPAESRINSGFRGMITVGVDFSLF